MSTVWLLQMPRPAAGSHRSRARRGSLRWSGFRRAASLASTRPPRFTPRHRCIVLRTNLASAAVQDEVTVSTQANKQNVHAAPASAPVSTTHYPSCRGGHRPRHRAGRCWVVEI